MNIYLFGNQLTIEFWYVVYFQCNRTFLKYYDSFFRFDHEIVRYGFFFNQFRIVVMNEKLEEVRKALSTVQLTEFPDIVIVCQSQFEENYVPLCGRDIAQGRKLLLHQNKTNEDEEKYGTLGCLALLNGYQTVALTCKHVFIESDTVYIENDKSERIPLGECLYTSREPTLQGDLAIIAINDEAERYITENKKILDHLGTPTKAEMCLDDTLSLQGEIVHKLGASSQWTQGEIVCAEILQNIQGMIAVRGMNGQPFGLPGDSGSIVFREMFSAKEQRLEILAILSGQFEVQKQSTERDSREGAEQKLIICLMLKGAFDQLKRGNDDLESIAFFND